MEGPKRTVLLSADVSNSAVMEAINTIIDVNAYDAEQEKKVVGYNREPIRFTINTFGGCAYSMLALCSAMKESKTPIHTYGYGCIMSAGLGIFALGHRRFADTHSTFMYHGVNYGMWGTFEGHERELNQSKKLQKYYDTIILNNSNLKKKELKEAVAKSTYIYLDGEEALAVGLVDELIGEGLKRERV